MNTFSDLVMRSHPSNLPDLNWQVYSDNETASFLSYFSKVHRSLKDYKIALMNEGAETGIPPVRALLLEFPND